MTRVTDSIDIAAPADRVFWAITDLETIPRFLTVVQQLEPLTAEQSRWTVEIAGQRRTFDARTTAIEPPTRVRYVSETPGTPFAVELQVIETGPGTSALTLDTEFDAGGMAEKLGLAKGIAQVAIQGQLKNAKQYLERRFGGE